MKINEIEAAHGIHTLSNILSIDKADKVGVVDHHNVYEQKLINAIVYFLEENNVIHAYVAVNGTTLHQIENLTKKSGCVTALIKFLIKHKNQRLVVDKNEPLTADGLNWFLKLIKSGGRGLVFKDQNDNIIDPEKLYKEWETSLENNDAVGVTSIVIESNGYYDHRIFEEVEGELKHPFRIIFDKEND